MFDPFSPIEYPRRRLWKPDSRRFIQKWGQSKCECCGVDCQCTNCPGNEAACCLIGEDGTDAFALLHSGSSCRWEDSLNGGDVVITATTIEFTTPNGFWSAAKPTDCQSFTVNFTDEVYVKSTPNALYCNVCSCKCPNCPNIFAPCCWVLYRDTNPLYLGKIDDCKWRGNYVCPDDPYTLEITDSDVQLSGPSGTDSISIPSNCCGSLTFPTYGEAHPSEQENCLNRDIQCAQLTVVGVKKGDCSQYDGVCEEINRLVNAGKSGGVWPDLSFSGWFCTPDDPIGPDGIRWPNANQYQGPWQWGARYNAHPTQDIIENAGLPNEWTFRAGQVNVSVQNFWRIGSITGNTTLATFVGHRDDAIGGWIPCTNNYQLIADPQNPFSDPRCDYSSAIAWFNPSPLCRPCGDQQVCEEPDKYDCPCGPVTPSWQVDVPVEGYNGWGPGVDETFVFPPEGGVITRDYTYWCGYPEEMPWPFGGPDPTTPAPAYRAIFTRCRNIPTYPGVAFRFTLEWWRASSIPRKAALSWVWEPDKYEWSCETTQWNAIDCTFADFGGTLEPTIHAGVFWDCTPGPPPIGEDPLPDPNPLWDDTVKPILTPV